MAAGTILRLGWTNPLTDAFGAHPLLGEVVDLNDGVTFTLLDGALTLDPPPRELALASNPRAQGERATRAIYRHNRQARAWLSLGPMASYSDLAANVRTLVRWLDAAPATPMCVQWQPPSATSPVYLDVVGAAHGIPADEREWLRLQLEPVEIVLLVRPGLRGDRVTLSNLLVNPGFEAPSTGNYVFSDAFANTNAYTLITGAAPSVAGSVMTIPAGAAVQFGSPTWGPIASWYVRFQYGAGGMYTFSPHRTDGANQLQVTVSSTQLAINHAVGGTVHALGSTSSSPAGGTWYWLQVIQFPSAPGTQCDLQAILYADSSGSIGSSLASVGPVASYDGVTSLTGYMAISAYGSSAALAIGGAYSAVHAVELFGPAAWGFTGLNGSTGLCSGAWEQSSANTYAGGAVASFGAARVDCAPAGSVFAYWVNYLGGPPSNAPNAIPATAGQTLGVSVWVRSSGVSATMSQSVRVYEYDSSGTQTRNTTVATLSGAQASWTQLAASLTLGANTAFVGVMLLASDATAGASANGTVWWDNCQCWNQTTTGQTTMPYCELRFPQSPAQLLVTGLLGDLPAPAHAAWGSLLASLPTGATLLYALGRRAKASAKAQLLGSSVGFYGTALSPTATAVLDASSYGGFYSSASVNPGWNPRAFSFPASDLLGVYHLFSRFYSAQAAGNLANVQTRAVTQQKSNPWYGVIGDTDQLGAYYGPFSAPLSASATWTVVDSGQITVPALPAGALTDLTQNYLTPRSQWEDLTSGGSTCRSDWQLLLPIDGSLLVGVVNNPSNGTFAVTNQWLWVYHDGLLVNRAAVGDAAATTYSLESAPTSNPARGAGGPGASSTGTINVNSGADPYLTLDPSIASAAVAGVAAGGSGVNQLAGYVAGGASGSVLPLHVELQYSPLYLYPR